MISFFKRFISKWKKSGIDKGNLPINFKGNKGSKISTGPPDADVHKLMVLATKIRRKEGYLEAIKFLKKIVDTYLKEGNTALVSCMNKLIPYMRKEQTISYEKIKEYIEKIINHVPKNEPYFLNLHLIMADHIKTNDTGKAIQYLLETLNKNSLTHHQYYLLIKLANLYILSKNPDEGKKILEKAQNYIKPCTDRFDHIKRERKLYGGYADLAFYNDSKNSNVDYLSYLFVEFLLDMAKVLNPMHIEEFHNRKDLYFRKKRGFANSEKFLKVLKQLNIEDEKDKILKQLYGFAFEELPLILGVSKEALSFKPGDSESLIEIREKKVFYRRPFKELPVMQKWVEEFIRAVAPLNDHAS